MTWTNGSRFLTDGSELRVNLATDGWWWTRNEGPYPTEREAQVAAEKAAGVHVEAVTPNSLRERLLALWAEAAGDPAVSTNRDFTAWSGTTKDLLLGMGLVWRESTGDYEFDAAMADPPQTPLAASVANASGVPTTAAIARARGPYTTIHKALLGGLQESRDALRAENAALRERVKALEGALRNCQAMAAREVRKSLPGPERDGWEHVLRFCREGGVESTVLRGDAATPDREEA